MYHFSSGCINDSTYLNSELKWTTKQLGILAISLEILGQYNSIAWHWKPILRHLFRFDRSRDSDLITEIQICGNGSSN